MSLAVVVPTLGRRAALDECLRHLGAQDDQDFRVVLVVDATADAAPLRIRFAASGLPGRVVQARLPGASAARNTGWRAVKEDVVLFLDDDVLADRGLVGAHRRLHATRPEPSVGAIGRLRWADGLVVTPFMRFLDGGWQFDTATLAGLEKTGWWHLYTCNCSVKTAALGAAGGLDEEGFPFGYEDLDLGRRMHERVGLELAVLDAAGAQHAHTMELDEWRSRVRRIARSERRFVHRYPDVKPYFRDRFQAALDAGPVRGRGARLAPYVPAGLPWLGPRVRGAADRWFAYELARPFLAAWMGNGEDDDPGPPPPPDAGNELGRTLA